MDTPNSENFINPDDAQLPNFSEHFPVVKVFKILELHNS